MRIIRKDRKKILFLFMVAEVICVVGMCVYYLNYQKQKYEFSYRDLTSAIATHDDNAQWLYVEQNDTGTNKGLFAATPELSLKKGSYVVSFSYKTGSTHNLYYVDCGDMAFVEYDRWKELNPNDTRQSFDMLVKVNGEKFRICSDFNGEGYLLINGITIMETKAYLRTWICNWILFFCMVDLIVFLFLYKPIFDERYKEKYKYAFLLIGIILITSLPVFTDYIQGVDAKMHILRIEGVAQGLLEGQIPVRIHPNTLAGHGYASGIFYPDLFLAIAAILRVVGYSVMQSYKVLLVCINIGTVLLSYYSFKRIFGNSYAGLIGSFFYSTAIYRMINLYPRGALGESIAMVFLPLLLWGMFHIFTFDYSCIKTKSQLLWVTPALAYTGIIESHVLSCAMVGLFTVLVCAALWKRVIKKEIFKQLLLTVLTTVLLNLWFIVPFMDSLSGDYAFEHMSEMTQNKGYFLQQLFSLYPIGDAFLYKNQVVGLGIIGGAIFFAWMAIKEKDCFQKQYMRVGLFCMIVGALALFMTTNLFPYDFLYQFGGGLEKFVSSIQFPWRFSSVAITFLTVGICSVALYIKQENPSKKIYMDVLYGITMMAIVVFLNQAMTEAVTDFAPYSPYGIAGVNSMDVSAGEYLPDQIDAQLLYFTDVMPGENVSVTNFEKQGTHIVMDVKNNSHNESYVEVPLINYPGYKVMDQATDKEMNISDGENHMIRITIPGNYENQVEVMYCEKVIWKIFDWLSIITFAGIVVYLLYEIRAKRKDNYLFEGRSI